MSEELCSDCPPVGYPTDGTRCLPCPRRASAMTHETMPGAERAKRTSEHIPTPEGRGGETLTTLLRRAKQTLCVPAAEYVPAMGDAILLLDKAIQMSYQTDPNWLLSSPRVEEVRRMREALTALRSLVREGGVPRYTVTPGAALNSVIEELVDPALSPPVG